MSLKLISNIAEQYVNRSKTCVKKMKEGCEEEKVKKNNIYLHITRKPFLSLNKWGVK